LNYFAFLSCQTVPDIPEDPLAIISSSKKCMGLTRQYLWSSVHSQWSNYLVSFISSSCYYDDDDDWWLLGLVKREQGASQYLSMHLYFV